MQGSGVTNYDPNKPSHSYTTQTTEFDDALLARNIVSFEQAMMAKGATLEEAKRLTAIKHEQDRPEESITYKIDSKTNDLGAKDDSDGTSSYGEDDKAIEEYRAKRLLQMKYGTVIPISRTEWNHEVNDASHSQWVVILLTSTSSAPNLNPYHQDMCLKVERDIVPSLANKFSEVKWISIPSKSAIENWPDDNLPTLFCYKMGKLQCQLVGLGEFGNIHMDALEYKLGKLGVLETSIENDPNANIEAQKTGVRGTTSYGRSKFQGGMATFATANSDDGSCSDYEDVD